MPRVSSSLVIALLVASSWDSLSLAQANDPLAGEEAAAAEEEEFDESTGRINDDPLAPDAITAEDYEERRIPQAPPPKVRITRQTFPQQHNLRPLTMPERMSEVSLDLRFMVEPTVDLWVRGRYGVTQDIEIGVTYGAFAWYLEGSSEFESGKAASFDAAYTVFPELLAVTASLAFNGDPFATAVAFGAPFRFLIGERVALYGGQDVLRVQLSGFAAEPADPVRNIAQSQLAAQTGVDGTRGEVNLIGGALFQHSRNLALYAEAGVEFVDFRAADAPAPLFVGATWSPGALTDVGARVGFRRPDDPGNSATLQLHIATRF